MRHWTNCGQCLLRYLPLPATQVHEGYMFINFIVNALNTTNKNISIFICNCYTQSLSRTRVRSACSEANVVYTLFCDQSKHFEKLHGIVTLIG